MKKVLFTTLLYCLLTLLLTCSCAEEITIGADIVFPENTVTFVGQTGATTPGLMFIVHDVYFDGYRLTLSITSAPNASGYTVYNDMPGQNYTVDEIEAMSKDGLIPIGAYCDIQLFDADGNKLQAQMAGSGSRKDATYVHTFCSTFLPEKKRNEIRVKVIYGMMETPGELLEDSKTFELLIPIQKEVTVDTAEVEETE